MIEKVNPQHPDKIADRIAGAIIDLAYRIKTDPKIAVEVLIGHDIGTIIIETDTDLKESEIKSITKRILGKDIELTIKIVPQDPILNSQQIESIRVGDNGIFRGIPLTEEERNLSQIAREIYS